MKNTHQKGDVSLKTTKDHSRETVVLNIHHIQELPLGTLPFTLKYEQNIQVTTCSFI